MRLKLLAVSGALLLLPIAAAFAASFSQLVVFGDSLSDNGNAYLGSNHLYPGANYGSYTFAGTNLTTKFYSDGPNTSPVATGPQGLWVDQLATRLGVADPQPFLAGTGGTDYAVASAQTGNSNPIDVAYQLLAFAGAHPTGAPSSALYALWAGANDIFNGKSPTQAANNLYTDILGLASQGAKTFLWLDLPLLGDTPEGASNKALLNAASIAFDTQWAADVKALRGDGLDVIGVDIGALFTKIIAHPGDFGLTNVTDPAQTSGAATDAGYLFWDMLHPTTTGHELVADAAYSALTATPEPAAMSLSLIGLAALAGLGLKKRASSKAKNGR